MTRSRDTVVALSGQDPLPEPSQLVGIEIEAEGVYSSADVQGWELHPEHSLRNGGIEWVLSQPAGPDELPELLERWESKSRDLGAIYSYRTSVHVHVDVRDLSLAQLTRLVVLSLALEPALFRIAGPQREFNNFCIGARFAKDRSHALSLILPGRPRSSDASDQAASVRYGAVNIGSVYKFGSLEYRGHRGTSSAEDILLWVRTLLHLKQAATGRGVVVFRALEDMLDPRPELWQRWLGEEAAVRLTDGGPSEGEMMSSVASAAVSLSRALRTPRRRPGRPQPRRQVPEPPGPPREELDLLVLVQAVAAETRTRPERGHFVGYMRWLADDGDALSAIMRGVRDVPFQKMGDVLQLFPSLWNEAGIVTVQRIARELTAQRQPEFRVSGPFDTVETQPETHEE